MVTSYLLKLGEKPAPEPGFLGSGIRLSATVSWVNLNTGAISGVKCMAEEPISNKGNPWNKQ